MLDRLLSRAEQADLLRQARGAFPGGVISSLHGSSASLLAALLFGDDPTPTLAVTGTLDEAEALSLDLTALLPEHPVLLFPELEILFDGRNSLRDVELPLHVAYHGVDTRR